MAFQMIPPRVSSSPPPLDSLPTITCQPEDEDDDFSPFCGGHNASFDITGLSDKLPPTPASSPTKNLPSSTQCVAATSDHLNERTTEDSISQDSGVSTENQTSECSPKLPSENENFGDFQSNMAITSNVNGEEANNLPEITEGKVLNNNDDDDFGDFECFSGEASRPLGNKFQESVVAENNKNVSNCKDEFTEDGAIIDRSSQILTSSIIKNAEEGTSGREFFPCSKSTSVNNSSNLSPPRSPAMVSPPPLDKLAPRRMSGGDEDEFGEFAAGHPGISEEDDDFGDFTSTNVNSSSTNCDSSNTVVGSSINLGYPPFHKKINENQEGKVNEINLKNRSKGMHSEQLENGVSCTVEKNLRDDIEVNKVLSEESSTAVSEDWQSAGSGELAGTEEPTGESFSDERLTNTNQILKNSSVQNNIEMGNDTRTLQIDGTNKLETPFKTFNTIGSSSKSDLNESFQGDNEFNGDDVDDDFGEFTDNYVQSNEVKSLHDDDVFDDFVSPESAIDDIRTTKSEKIVSDVSKSSSVVNEVVSCRNLNPSNVVDDDDDFGEFDSARRDSLDFDDIRSQVVSRGISEVQCNDDLENNDIGDNDFGDFETAVSSRDPVSDCGKAGIDENNDFGDFSNADFTKHNLDEDDFGDFNASIETENFRSFRTENSSNTNTNSNQSFDQFFSTFEEDKSPVVRKLESLLLRWIPPISREERSTDITTRRLQQMVKEDAFIWHQLEDLDSSPALNLAWPQSHVHKLFLASVNVDARNIVSSTAMTTLFGQKWSSSVPLFAQTLTFSPLTPAKHIESTGECLEREDLVTKCPQNPLEDAVGGMTGEGTATEGDTEEQIPEPKFDWTSSGLTNPLESTGLEREFLSESSSTGVSGGGRMKTPPSPSPLVQQILSGSSGSSLSALTATTNVTPITSLQPEVQEVVAKLPDLSFMKSRVLMFPIRGEQ